MILSAGNKKVEGGGVQIWNVVLILEYVAIISSERKLINQYKALLMSAIIWNETYTIFQSFDVLN